jgi:two-component system, chemotaxis family, response regulator PixG
MQRVVLVIDDDEKVRELIADILEAFDFKVIPAESSEEGLTHALEHKPDIILCDVILPDALGFETAKVLNQHPETACIPVVLMTGFPYMRHYRLDPSIKLLMKPFSMQSVVAAVKEALGMLEKEQANVLAK